MVEIEKRFSFRRLISWRNKEIKDIKELEEEFKKLQQKSHAELITFLGIREKIKGLNLVYYTDDLIDHKLLAGVFAELFQNIQLLKNEFLKSALDVSIIQSQEKSLIFAPITDSVVFLSILPNNKHNKTIQDWFSSRKQYLKNIFTI